MSKNNNKNTDFELSEALEGAAIALILMLGSAVAISAFVMGLDLFDESSKKSGAENENLEKKRGR